MGDGLGLGELVSVELPDGLGEGDGDGLGEPVGDDVPDGDGDGLADGLAEAGPALQLADAVGDVVPLWPIGAPVPFTPLECPCPGAPLPEPPPAIGVLLPAAWIRAGGTAVMAKDRPVTTRKAAAIAAAGRSHLTHPVPPSSGRNRSMKSANAYHNRSTTAQNAYHIRIAIGSRYLATAPIAASRPVKYLLHQ